MATQKLPEGGSGLDPIIALAELFGGRRTTTSVSRNADTSGLEAVLSQLQGTNNYEQLLQSIFSRAGGEIPGLNAAYSNAMGARSRGNSAVQAAINRLLESTVLQAQGQIAQQQQSNLDSQGRVAGQITDATRTETQTQHQRTPLGPAATVLGAGTLLNRNRDIFGRITDLFGGGSGGGGSLAPAISGAELLFPAIEAPITSTVSNFVNNAGGSLLDSIGGIGGGIGGGIARGIGGAWDFVTSLLGFADGGAVSKEEFQAKLKEVLRKSGEAQKFAEGGTVRVRSGGGRPSSQPSYDPVAPQQTSAINEMNDLIARLFAPAVQEQSQAEEQEQDAAGAGDTATGIDPNAAPMSITEAISAFGTPAAVAAGLFSAGPVAALAATISNAISQQSNALSQPVDPIANAVFGIMAPTGLNPLGGSGFADPEANAPGFGLSFGPQGFGDAPGGDQGLGGFGEGFGNDPGFSEGGEVEGPGGPKDDMIPALLSDGEFVIKAEVVKKFGEDFFKLLNESVPSRKAA